MKVPAEDRVDRSFWLMDHEGVRYFPIRVPRKGLRSESTFRLSAGGNRLEDTIFVTDISKVRSHVVADGFSVRAVAEHDITAAPSLLKLNGRKITDYGPRELQSEAPNGFWSAFAKSAAREDAGWSLQTGSAIRVSNRGSNYVFCAFNTNEGWVRIGTEITGKSAEETYERLLSKRALIERDAGEALIWDAKQDRTKRQVFMNLVCDPSDFSDWPMQHAWLQSRLPAFERLLERL